VDAGFSGRARSRVLCCAPPATPPFENFRLWDRFLDPGYWWMHAMVLVWSLFAMLLFIGEPLILRRHFPAWAARDPLRAFAWLHWMHIFLLVISLITILGAVAGAHGWQIFSAITL